MRCRLGLPAIAFDFANRDALAGILMTYYRVTLILAHPIEISMRLLQPVPAIQRVAGFLLGYPFEGIPNAGSNLQEYNV